MQKQSPDDYNTAIFRGIYIFKMVTLNKKLQEAKRFYDGKRMTLYGVTRRFVSSSVMFEAGLDNSASLVQRKTCTAQIHPLAGRK